MCVYIYIMSSYLSQLKNINKLLTASCLLPSLLFCFFFIFFGKGGGGIDFSFSMQQKTIFGEYLF